MKENVMFWPWVHETFDDKDEVKVDSLSLLEVLEDRWIQRHHEVLASRPRPLGPVDLEFHGHPNMIKQSIINQNNSKINCKCL